MFTFEPAAGFIQLCFYVELSLIIVNKAKKHSSALKFFIILNFIPIVKTLFSSSTFPLNHLFLRIVGTESNLKTFYSWSLILILVLVNYKIYRIMNSYIRNKNIYSFYIMFGVFYSLFLLWAKCLFNVTYDSLKKLWSVIKKISKITMDT